MSSVRKRPHCQCSKEFRIVVGSPGEYPRAKKIFDRSRHPTFIGPSMVERSAANGGLIFVRWRDEDLGVRIVNPRTGVGLALSIMPKHRGHGLGAAVVDYTRVNIVRVIEALVPWYEQRGYVATGPLIKGRKLFTQVMVRRGLTELAGRLAAVFAERIVQCERSSLPTCGR